MLKTVWEVTAALESAKAEIGSYRTIVAKSDTDAARAKVLPTAEATAGELRRLCCASVEDCLESH